MSVCEGVGGRAGGQYLPAVWARVREWGGAQGLGQAGRGGRPSPPVPSPRAPLTPSLTSPEGHHYDSIAVDPSAPSSRTIAASRDNCCDSQPCMDQRAI
jgi:hypothetical protein